MLVWCFLVGSTGLFDAYPFQVGTRYTLPETNFGMRVGIPYLKCTLPETNSEFSPENGWSCNTNSFVSFWVPGLFSGAIYCYVSFREGSEPGHDFQRYTYKEHIELCTTAPERAWRAAFDSVAPWKDHSGTMPVVVFGTGCWTTCCWVMTS